jgi:hypothetical protein
MTATAWSILNRRCSPFLVYCRVTNRNPDGWNADVTCTVDWFTVSMSVPKSKSSGSSEITWQ